MRLTCPNCGAQYEVPDEVIPAEGRDVQCSNCGATWFQAHDQEGEQPSSDADLRAAINGLSQAPDAVEEPEPRDEIPEPVPEEPEEAEAEAEAEQPDPRLQPAPQRPGRELAPEVTDILRAEAQHEAELREAEARAAVESQPDLGLDNLPDDSERRAKEAQTRMARMRGETEDPGVDLLEEAESASRRNLLPDIDELNSSLRDSSEQTAIRKIEPAGPETASPIAARNGGFSTGFALALVLAAALLLLYTNAPDIAQKVPQADPFLNALVAKIDQVRFWLDAQVKAILPQA